MRSYEEQTAENASAYYSKATSAKQYDFSAYDKERIGNMWVLSKNGKVDQEAARASEAYNEAIKNGEIQLEGP
ncbi:hypothetical protein J416_02134, partial [Gracilibacillus halophilus YIM-C55.5]